MTRRNTSYILFALLSFSVGLELSQFSYAGDSSVAPKVTIIGHRGGSESAPENTLAAFRSGFADGADGVELDFRCTSDGRLIVSHDATLKRCGGVDLEISHTTFDELRKVNIADWGKWRGRGFNEPVPTLDEALATLPPGRRFYLHCYTGRLEIHKVRDAILRSHVRPEDITLICFERGPCATFKKLLPQSKALWLLSRNATQATEESIQQWIRAAQDDHLDGLSFNYQFPLTKELAQKLHSVGLEVHAWTVNDAGVAQRLVGVGIDSVTTDQVKTLRASIQQSY